MEQYIPQILIAIFIQTVVFSIICFSLWARIQLLEREVLRTRQALNDWTVDVVRDFVKLIDMFAAHKEKYHTRGGSENE